MRQKRTFGEPPRESQNGESLITRLRSVSLDTGRRGDLISLGVKDDAVRGFAQVP